MSIFICQQQMTIQHCNKAIKGYDKANVKKVKCKNDLYRTDNVN